MSVRKLHSCDVMLIRRLKVFGWSDSLPSCLRLFVYKEGRPPSCGKTPGYLKDPEHYVTFITPEACIAIEKYLEFRAQHGEEFLLYSPLFREKFNPISGLNEGKHKSNNINAKNRFVQSIF